MTALLAYCDPISAAPGERVRFMVSCIGAARYDAEIVRLINPQAGPLADAVSHRADRVPGQPQLPGASSADPCRLLRRGRGSPGIRLCSPASPSRPTSGRPRRGVPARRCSAPGRRPSAAVSGSASTRRARPSCASATAPRWRRCRPAGRCSRGAGIWWPAASMRRAVAWFSGRSRSTTPRSTIRRPSRSRPRPRSASTTGARPSSSRPGTRARRTPRPPGAG